MPKVSIISLGCPRNQVDSEVMAGSLKKGGFRIVGPSDEADVRVINTCAFIRSAREESAGMIAEAARLKREGRIKRLVICGCLPQLYREELAAGLREADLVLGTSDFPRLAALLKDTRKLKKRSLISRSPGYLYDEHSPRLAFTPPHYAYLKISEGCSNFCSYCIISRLRGPFRSRSVKSVLEEMRRLSRPGRLKEVILVGQDTTLFGIDRYGKPVLSELLRRACGLKNSVEWIRLLYTHPAHYTDELISVISSEEKICKYLDLPVQHISDPVLKRMNRRVTKKEITALIGKLRRKIPGLALRTSMIVGFPGETDRDFRELVDFARDARFEKLGAFLYSREEGTPSSRLAGQVPEKVKRERFDILMKLQQSVSRDINKKYLGRAVDVLIDEELSAAQNAGRRTQNEYIGRARFDAPEIDGVVYVGGKDIKVGNIYKVRIKDTLEYDLAGDKI